MEFRDILNASGYTMAQLNAKYGIPERTMRTWKAGTRKPPEYVLTMLSDILILERRLKDGKG